MIASAAVFVAWLMFRISPWLVIIPLPFIIIFGILGVYHREDQPVETYFLAAINFFTKPRKRKWDPEGHVENVRITAPKTKAQATPKQLERGQLERLAHIVDTRGWYVKRPELQEPMEDTYIGDDDRLINPTQQLNQDPLDVHMTDDMLSPTNPTLEDYTDLAEQTHSQAKAAAIAKMQAAAAAPAVAPPVEIHYNPYPQGKQHKLDPLSGQYGTASNQAPAINATQAASLKALDPNVKISNIPTKTKQTGSSNLVLGQEISLRPK